jgi:steroid delta-isomerase-like uncharacterized protein
MSDANKAFVREFYTQVWNEHRADAAATYYAAAYTDHNVSVPDQPGGVEGAHAVFSTFLAAFPDVRFTLDLQVAEGNLVATRWTATGTNSGSLMGMPPTGRQVTVTGIDIFRVEGGKIVERWGSFDLAGMMQQLGAPQA